MRREGWRRISGAGKSAVSSARRRRAERREERRAGRGDLQVLLGPEVNFDRLWAVLGRFWAGLDRFWAVLDRFWAVLDRAGDQVRALRPAGGARLGHEEQVVRTWQRPFLPPPRNVATPSHYLGW